MEPATYTGSDPMNALLVIPLVLAAVFATTEAYGQSTEFLVPLGVVGQSGAQNASSIGINIDALSQPTMEITVFGETVTVTHEETYFKSDTEYTYVFWIVVSDPHNVERHPVAVEVR